jgi:hypothetical protein
MENLWTTTRIKNLIAKEEVLRIDNSKKDSRFWLKETYLL